MLEVTLVILLALGEEKLPILLVSMAIFFWQVLLKLHLSFNNDLSESLPASYSLTLAKSVIVQE